MKKLLFKLLGVDRLVRRAFREGWDMRGDNFQAYPDGEVIEIVIWKDVRDAWANSDVEEEI